MTTSDERSASDGGRDGAGALAGLRVLDTATLYAGPYISTLLADHGAEVIKVEPPGGDPYRNYPNRMWPILARGKRSIVLDTGTDDGSAAVRELARDVDVIVVNMPTKVLEKRGLDYATLSALNPDLIFVHLTGFGLGGPYSDQPGNGTLAEALGGLTHMTGPTDGAPVLASVPLGDAVTGLAGAFGVLAACYHRKVNGGGGQMIDVNPLDAILHVIGPVLTEYSGEGEPPTRLGNRLKGSIVRNVFETGDDQYVSISLSTPRHISDIAEFVGHADWDDSGAVIGDLEASIRAWTTQHPRQHVVDELVARRLPVAPVYTAADIVADPHIQARQSVGMVMTEKGPVLSPAPVPRLLGSVLPLAATTPALDEYARRLE